MYGTLALPSPWWHVLATPLASVCSRQRPANYGAAVPRSLMSQPGSERSSGSGGPVLTSSSKLLCACTGAGDQHSGCSGAQYIYLGNNATIKQLTHLSAVAKV